MNERLRTIVSDSLGVRIDQVKPEVKLSDLGADSLDLVELYIKVEDEFDFEMVDEETAKIVTVGDLAAYVERAVHG